MNSRIPLEEIASLPNFYLPIPSWGGDKRDMGLLKDRVTGDHLVVDRKNIAAVSERSMLHLIIASNEEWPVGVDRDDRRFVALKVVNPRAKDPRYFEPLYDELLAGGRSAFLAALMGLTVDDRLLREPPETAAKAELKQRSMGPEAEWWQEKLHEGRVLQTDRKWPAAVSRSALYADYLQFMQNMSNPRRLAPNRLGGKLSAMCPSVSVTKPHGKQREYRLPTLDRARLEFEKFMASTIDWESAVQNPLPEPPDDDAPPF